MILLTLTIIQHFLFSRCSCAVSALADRQASSRGQKIESNPIFDIRRTSLTANDSVDAISSPLGKDSHNYNEEQFFKIPSSAAKRRALIERKKRKQLQRRLAKSQKRKRQPKYLTSVGVGYTDTGAKTGKSSSTKSAKKTPSPAPSVSSNSSYPRSNSSEPSASLMPTAFDSLYEFVGEGVCLGSLGRYYDAAIFLDIPKLGTCASKCTECVNGQVGSFRGFTYRHEPTTAKARCYCHIDKGASYSSPNAGCDADVDRQGIGDTGEITKFIKTTGFSCYKQKVKSDT